MGMAAPLTSWSAIKQRGERHLMRSGNGINRVNDRRRIAAAIVVCAGLLLASCAGGASEDGFSAYVADHWPHWAGGMPDDVPPRPGTPGYRKFIAHGEADQDQPPPAVGANAAAPAAPVFQTTPAAPAAVARTTAAAQVAPAAPAAAEPPVAADVQAAPAEQAPPQSAGDDSSVVRGGLY